jgi:hypothetical protein
MTSMINPEDEDFREYRIKVSNLAKVIGLKDKDFYSKIQKITKEIIKKTLQIEQEDGLLQVNWISSAKYYDKEGVVSLTFDPKLKPYLLQLKNNFTSTKYGITIKFKSFYTTRIYLLIKQYQKIGERTISVESLKDIFPQYELYKDIKRRIITPAHNEICKTSDIKFDIKEEKVGKKVKGLIFYNIRSQVYASELPLFPPPIKKEESIPEMIHRKYRVDLNVAANLAETIEEKDLSRIFKYIDSVIARGKVKSLSGFVVKCLKEKYYKEEIKFEQQEVSAVQEEIKCDNKNKIWKKILTSLEAEFNKEIFDQWIINLNFVKKDGNTIVLATKGDKAKFYRDWIKREYFEEIKEVISFIYKDIERVNIISIT